MRLVLALVVAAGCGRVGFDVEADADDRDGDGVADSVDNCPAVSNPDQANEDGDAFGDACDPCPPIAGDASDRDGDGVGDACDPNPDSPGDRLLIFEGFHHGVPAGWEVVGPWVAAPDAIRVDATDGAIDTVMIDVAATGTVTVRAHAVVETVVGQGNRSVSVAVPYQSSGDLGTMCGLGIVGGTTDPLFLIVDIGTPNVLASSPHSFDDGNELDVALTRAGQEYGCVLEGGATPLTTSFAFVPPTSKLGIRAHSASARYDWIMVTSSP